MWLALACVLSTSDPTNTGPHSSSDADVPFDDVPRDSAHADTDSDSGVAPPPLSLAIPAYVWPEDPAYAAWVAGAGPAGGLVVLNPASGPGAAPLDAYVTAVAAARAGGVTVLGYVHTSYGVRPATEVDAETLRWFEFYDIDGIFFDEVASDCASEPWYADRANIADTHAFGGDAFVAFNPGVEGCEEHLASADLLVLGEDAGSNLLGYTAPIWSAAYSPERFWLLAHDADAATMRALLRVASDQGIGRVYVTDDRLPNPWDGLPSYWNEEVAALTAAP